MKELEGQSKFIEVIKNRFGGYAYKSSNRFLIGVCDIVAQIPEQKTWFVEAKYGVQPMKKQSVFLDVTVPQSRFLKSMSKATAPCFILSFLQGLKRNDRAVLMIPFHQFLSMPEQECPLDLYSWGKNWEDEMEREIRRMLGE